MKNLLKAALAADRVVLGYLVTMPSVAIVQALAASSADFVMIDMEHSAIGIETVAAMVAATNGMPAVPIVRVPGPRSEMVKPVLDCGAFGVVFPRVSSAADAKAALAASRYTPHGSRGYGPTYAALRWGVPPLEYLRIANSEVLNILLIESLAGVAALDEILRLEGPDVVAVARGDLAESLGLPGEFDHPQITQLVADAERKILPHARIAAGGIAFAPEEARAMIARGYRFIVLGTDAGLIQRTAAAQLDVIRR